jgi:hypothetical protein
LVFVGDISNESRFHWGQSKPFYSCHELGEHHLVGVLITGVLGFYGGLGTGLVDVVVEKMGKM